MQAACGVDDPDRPTPSWYAAPPVEALPLAGEDYLRHILSPEQLALRRVAVRDLYRFPELGRRYLEVTAGGRDRTFAGYLDRWAGREGWTVRDKGAAAQTFAGLLKSRPLDEAVLGLRNPSSDDIVAAARSAAANMLTLLSAGDL